MAISGPSFLPSAASVEESLSAPTPELVSEVSGIREPVGILGAGGKMGLHVALMMRRALDLAGRRDVPVVAVSRFPDQRTRGDFESRGVRTISADLIDPAALGELPGFGSVFFLAGKKFGHGGDADELKTFNHDMPARVAERYREATIVALSTGCVYPFVRPETGGSREGDAIQPQGAYAESCHGREQAFAAVAARHGTPTAIIRLNYSVEYRYGVLLDIARKVRAGSPVDVTMGYVNVIWQRDAVAHILRARSVASSPARILNVAGTPVISVREIAERFGRQFGKKPVITGREEADAWLSDASCAHRLFGPPETPLDEMIRRVAAWLAEGRETREQPTKFETRDGKF
ncbi:NAD(P)-dependent oxidoreductase [Luteolibacter sp. SL250]|uniref:NAD-dependent epimerase/dehydratase family protein n=1 Tax=Luteolibacter sp. SL250 TaxID=2995170 RepID=UPI002270D3B7|nr:NAD(P)-dependent oxidoreductase [Luteolibacter sp. SL250]WAC19101.1 NAD(P)-dependent oxidoreductase [Luteolibacter sp. SL250]